VLAPGDQFNVVLPIDFNNRHWNAYFSAPKASWYSRFDTWLPWLAMACGFTGSLLFFLLFHTLSSSRMRAVKMAKEMTRELRTSQARLQQSHHKLRRLAAHSDQIKEQERKRIAREIHDDLGQNLLVLRIDVDMLCTRTRHRHPRLHARAAHAGPDRPHHQERAPHHQRPAPHRAGPGPERGGGMADRPVPPALRHGVRADRARPDIRIDDHCATAFFRVLQESLSNILQHAHASLVRVELRQATAC
jgi:signal transduction histidine kinase